MRTGDIYSDSRKTLPPKFNLNLSVWLRSNQDTKINVDVLQCCAAPAQHALSHLARTRCAAAARDKLQDVGAAVGPECDSAVRQGDPEGNYETPFMWPRRGRRHDADGRQPWSAERVYQVAPTRSAERAEGLPGP